MRHGPPADLHLADDVLLRHHAPVAAVGAVVPVVSHHEVVALGNDLRSEVVVAAVLRRDVVVAERHVVHVHASVHDADDVVLLRDHPLDERLVGVDRVVEHHDVAAPRVGQPVGQFVDDQPVLVGQRRRHALALDARDLEAEGHDERGVDRRREQRLHPGEHLVAHVCQRDGRTVRGRVRVRHERIGPSAEGGRRGGHQGFGRHVPVQRPGRYSFR